MNAKLETFRHIAQSRPFDLSADASAFPYPFKPFFDLINYLLQFDFEDPDGREFIFYRDASKKEIKTLKI